MLQYTCRNDGHWARGFPERQSRVRKRNSFEGKCLECGAYDHRKADCWELSKNANRSTHNCVSRENCTHVASASIEDYMANEIFVANIDFGEFNFSTGVKKMDFFDEELITGQDGPVMKVTG